MSGPATAPALQFTVAGESSPRKVIHADGSVAFRRAGAAADEPPTTIHRQLSGGATWDPPELAPHESATLLVPLPGARPGDVVSCGHSGLSVEHARLQLTAIAGEGEAVALLVNMGERPANVGSGELRLVATQLG